MNDLVVSFLVTNVMAILMMAIAIVYGLCKMDRKDVGIMSLIMIESYFFVVLFLILTGLVL